MNFQKAESDIHKAIESYHGNPGDAASAERLRDLRREICGSMLQTDQGDFEALFRGSFGAAYRLCLKSGFQCEALTAEEEAFTQNLARDFAGAEFDFGALLAFLLHRLAHHHSLPLEFERIPGWFLDDYLLYLFRAPQGFMNAGEADQYYNYLLACLTAIEDRVHTAPGAALTIKAAIVCMEHLNVIQVYFTRANVKELMTKRARIFEYLLEKNGAKLDAGLPGRPPGRSRIKVGFLNGDLSPRVETYTTLPAMHLDRNRFEVCLFVQQLQETPVTEYCRALADSMVKLPGALNEQVEIIRDAALDVLIIGTNITAVSNGVARLAMHRLAPLQILNYNSPLTSGMRHIDGYITGTQALSEGAQAHFSEKLLALEGSPNCLDFSVDSPVSPVRLEREKMGIKRDTVIFVSAATCYKVIPEMQEIWAKIIESVPGSLLLLIPFNPNWSSGFPVKQFERSLTDVFIRHGLDAKRFMLSPSLPNRAAVMEVLSLGDVYLDTFPFTGSVSVIDPLKLAVPPVVWEGETHRSRLASSLLRDLGITSLISNTDAGYIEIAVRLAKDIAYRRDASASIGKAMAENPAFLDCTGYGKKLGDLLESLVPKLENPPLQNPVAEVTAPGEDPLQAALRLHTCSHFAEAEELYRQILLANPENAEAWHLMGVLAHQCGNDESAVEFIEQALQFVPGAPVYWNNLAEAYNGRGMAEKACECCRRALELQPDFAEAMVTLAALRRSTGALEESMELLARALRIKPGYGEGLLQYGLALMEKGDCKKAISYFKKACAANPGSVEARYHLGMAWEETGRYVEALACYEQASKCNPHVGEVWHRWGTLLVGLGEAGKAELVLREALRCNDAEPEYHYQLGRALQMACRSQEALSQFNQAIERGGDTPELYNNRGIILKEQGKGFAAAESFFHALKLKPDMISALNNLGAVCVDIGMTSEALECIELLIAKRPDLPSAHNNLGKLLKDSGRAAEALPAYQRAIELNPTSADLQDNYLLCINYVPGRDPRENFEAHRAWGERTARRIPRRYQGRWQTGPAERKLRIGYVSADLCQHPVAVFIEGLLARQDRERFELTAYCDTKRPDKVTERLKGLVDRWRQTSEMSHDELARQVWKDKIDILVDLSGHTAWNRLEMFAMKPAPVQVSYLGYPATTGLPAMDYRITDASADPVGSTEHLHTERLVRLPSCAWCYQAPQDAPAIGVNPAAEAGYVTFGCFNNLAKLNSHLFDLWIRLLERVPGAHLKLKARTLHDSSVKQNIIKYFTGHGIEAERLDIVGYVPSVAGHLGVYQGVDISLDSFPYHGTTTTCEALWMGTPVVTLAGTTHVSRVGVSLLNAVGLPDLIASAEEDYVDIAARLASDEARRVALRTGLRERMLGSPLMNPATFATAMDEAFIEMWRQYAEGRK